MATRRQCRRGSDWTLAQAASCSWKGRVLRQQARQRLFWWLEDWESAWGIKVRIELSRIGCLRGRLHAGLPLLTSGSKGDRTRYMCGYLLLCVRFELRLLPAAGGPGAGCCSAGWRLCWSLEGWENAWGTKVCFELSPIGCLRVRLLCWLV
jgi:hypothetical protein